MTIMKIEVFPDTSQPAGGHAVIRLKGIALLPPGTTFRIDPIDETLDDGEFNGWPRGDLSPLDTRQTPEGIEMRIGPDVVDAPLLEPGTPVTISVPDSHLSAELIWPDLPLSSSLTSAPVVFFKTCSVCSAILSDTNSPVFESSGICPEQKTIFPVLIA